MSIENLDEFICPACLARFDLIEQVDPKWLICPECDSEAMDIDLMPLRTFLKSTSVETMEDWRDRIDGQPFLTEYKHLLKSRVDEVIADLKAMEGS